MEGGELEFTVTAWGRLLWAPQPSSSFFSPLETVQDRAERDQYELLCPDNTRKSVDEFKDCYLAQVPFHTIVGRRVKGNEDEIWNFLSQAQVSIATVLLPAWVGCWVVPSCRNRPSVASLHRSLGIQWPACPAWTPASRN